MAEQRIICADFREVIGTLPDDAVVVGDPPFNIGYSYGSYKDGLAEDDYMAMLKEAFGTRPSVVIHYPEALYRLSIALGKAPDKVVAWVYNSNLPRQHRDIAYFGIAPDLSLERQMYKNPSDARVKRLIAEGHKGPAIYDWWEVQQVKGNSSEKSGHPCQMPLEVMRRIIATLPPGRLIFDPFSGSGTTALACRICGRDFIGTDIDPDYCRMAKERLDGDAEAVFVNGYEQTRLF